MTLIIAFGLVGCDKRTDSTKATAVKAASSNATIEDNKLPVNAPTYKMAVAANYAPFAFKDEKGTPVGFDIDLIKAIGENQGFKVEVLNEPWDGIFDKLDSNSRDLVGSGVVATEERKGKMDFSMPYLQVPLTAVVLSNNTAVNSFNDLKSKNVGVEEGASTQTDTEKFMGEKATNVKLYPSSFLAFQDMIKGNIDASIDNGLLNQYYINGFGKKNNLSFKTFDMPDRAPNQLVFAIKKGNSTLVNKVNAGLANVKKDGTYDRIYKKWFGDAPVITVSAPAATTITTSATNLTAATATSATK